MYFTYFISSSGRITGGDALTLAGRWASLSSGHHAGAIGGA